MLKNSIGHFEPQIKSNLNGSDSSHDALAGLSFIRHCNEQLVEELDDTLVKLVKYQRDDKPRKLGCWKDKVHIAEDFDDLPASLEAAFRGESE